MFARHPRIAQALYNHQDALRQRAAQREPSCRCEAIKRYAPEAPAYDGHAVASGFHFQRGRSTLERQLISGSSGDTCFPSKAPMWEQFPGHYGVPPTICRDLPGILNRCFMRCGRNMPKQWLPSTTTGLSIVDSVKSKTEGALCSGLLLPSAVPQYVGRHFLQ